MYRMQEKIFNDDFWLLGYFSMELKVTLTWKDVKISFIALIKGLL
jgi:hypothetical protein